jgi:two-component system chemotaxis sensor kinase CheA
MDGMDDIIGEFLVESNESLDRLDRELIELEADPASRELLASIFRTVHTIKGTAGFLGFGQLEVLTHAGENLLSLLRDGKLVVDADMTSGLLTMVDAIRNLLAVVECTGSDADIDSVAIESLAERLDALADPDPATEVVAIEVPEADSPVAPTEVAVVDVAPAEPSITGGGAEGPNTEGSIRVDVRLLDQLMNLVGELVLARNQILQFTVAQQDAALVTASQQLNLITTELQEGVMKTRMQPIGNIWGKFPRVVRDLATLCSKQVRIEMEGEETELDKTIIEAIKDPLTHVVRNAVDHGIEAPAARIAAGKAPEGALRLRAYHEGGQVIIEIADDGAGLDHERIQQKAVERGLLTAELAGRMSEREIANLIFLPGFSTAATVTNVSGRGVGMDVVKTNIEKIGGTVDVQSKRGVGTTLTVKIPLTLAIIPALIVACDGDRYAIPQVNLVELLRLDDGIEYVSGAPVYRLRGRLLPIVHLREVFGLTAEAPDVEAPGQQSAGRACHVAVLHAENQQFGLVVDRIDDSAEIVVKPLGPHLKGLSAFAGTTIMGDGNVALILDAVGLGQQGGVLSGATAQQQLSVDDTDDATQGARRRETQTVVVCAVGERRIALPIALVSRLEEFERTELEHAGGRDVIQYCGGLLTLVSLTSFFDPTAPDPLAHGATRSSLRTNGELRDVDQTTEGTVLQVLVHETADDVFGFVVDAIVDIADIDASDGQQLSANGVVVSGVVGRRVTDLVDIAAILRQVDVDYRDPRAAEPVVDHALANV